MASPTSPDLLAKYGYNPFSIVPHPDVALLRCRTAESGFRNVYRVHSTDLRYEACVKVNRVKQRLIGSRAAHPQVCALYVLCWYRDRFGAAWRDAILGRHLRPAPVCARYSPARKGWCARVWEYGKPVEVTGRRLPGHECDKWDTRENVTTPAPGRPCDRLCVFHTKAQALRFAVGVWAARRWGAQAKSVLWKIPDPVGSPVLRHTA